MSSLRQPGFEKRRSAELSAELVARAKAWLSTWQPPEPASDFASALFAITARFESEVAQRLDKVPEKMYRGFLQWLGVRGLASGAAQLPLVFGLAPGTNSEPVLAAAPVQAQATPPQSGNGTAPEPITFETEDDVMIVPGSLAALIAADPVNDAFYRAPSGFSSLQAPTPGPAIWKVVTTAKAGSTQIQLDPPTGLESLPTLLDPVTNALYTVTATQNGLVTVDPPVSQTLAQASQLNLQNSFTPFGAAKRNLQKHMVYIGSDSLLNLPTSATIGINGIAASNISWFYWGKQGSSQTADWQKLLPVPGASTLTLSKKAGSIDEYSVDGKSSRWLKGTVDANSGPQPSASTISLVINPTDCGQTQDCPPSQPPATPVAIEGMANTTPLVLNAPFYPLGREPRLFDAFYIGCPEAFSKSNAMVTLCLQALDGTSVSFSAAQASTGTATSPVLFGIGSDGFMHRMRPGTDSRAPIIAKTAVRPPFDQSGRATMNSTPVSLSWPQGRLSIYPRDNDSLVAVVAGNDVWAWSENPDPDRNGKWYFLGTPSNEAITLRTPPVVSKDKVPAVLLMQDGPSIHTVALVNGALYEASLTEGWENAGIAQWSRVTAPGALTWSVIAPVFDQKSPSLAASFANGWIAVASDGRAFLLQGVNGNTLLKPLPNLATSRPLAVRPPGQPLLLISAMPAGAEIDAWTVAYDLTPISQALAKVSVALSGDSLDWTVSSQDGPGAVFATKNRDGEPTLAVWYPQATKVADPNTVYFSPSVAVLAGSPAVIPGLVVAPGTDAAILVSPFDPNGLKSTSVFSNNLATALVIDNAPDHPKKDDVVVVKSSGGKRKAYRLNKDASNVGGNRYWIEICGSKGNAKISEANAYRPIEQIFEGTVNPAAPDQIEIDAADNTHTTSGPLVVTLKKALSFHTITGSGTGFITVKPKIRGVGSSGKNVAYQYLNAITPSSVLPVVTQNLASDLDKAVQSTGANFQGGQPAPNPLFFVDPAAEPTAYVLQNLWTVGPKTDGIAFSLINNGLFKPFLFLGGSVAANPALSWEYFDGNAWWKIPTLNDKTSNLRTKGTVSFCVPAGLQQTDVAGKKSYWIRARLVGGDYGQETVTVTTTPGTGGSSTQTINRSQSGIAPPLIGAANLTYSMCCATNPDFVLTSDGGTLIDQTAVNNYSSAQIQLFLPLSASIQAAASGITPDDASSGPAIYLGFDGPIQGGPINILFLVKDQDLGAAYPLRVDVLSETGFVPIIPTDGTRGLGESGILSLYLPDLPALTTLFGSFLRWLRLRPSALLADTTTWTPAIDNAYVNAVYALASQTQKRERLGSSDGSPNQQVTVARPPVLEGSLEIRVLEPLDDEQVQALQAIDSNNVLTTLADPSPTSQLTTPSSTSPPQSWVLWTEIDVIEKAKKTDRYYTLDNDSGEITFGDGIHGMIPPIGVDSIVARIYKRGGGSAANSVTKWTSVNLISPIQGISQVVAPDDAAGGSDPQTSDDILRLAPALEYMRDRALTLRDFEMLAVQSSRDIAQARALASGAGIRLVVAARGSNPQPTQAQWRAILAYLTDRCSPSLAAQNAIVKVPPRLVQVQVTLKFDVEDIKFSGSVAQAATAAIVALFDPASGGFANQGWPLGVLPTETDIAGALADVPNLLAIETITLKFTLTTDDSVVQTALPEDLPVADPGDIQIAFQVTPIEVSA